MADIEIEIDGQTLTAQPGQMVIQVADAAGIYIPRFCYHKHLTIAANCRMCLVEVEKSPKALPACATPVANGMKIFTRSQKTIEAQRAVMEFLLINHPLDCPICDQGGECELQDLSMGYGASHSDYDECKRANPDLDLGPLVATEMTRCIYCTRCVRFGDEIAGMRELGATSRGEHTEITTYVQHAIKSEVSGNIIDLCPVGALTSKPFRFTARAWELDQTPSIAPHDCVGSNINVHTRNGIVMRVVSHENAAVNETWLSDRDRFSYSGLYHADRILEPKIRVNGVWQIVEWQTALEFAAERLQTVIATSGAHQVGALASPNSTVEEFYLLQKIMRSLGSDHVDHRLRATDMSDQTEMPMFPALNMSLQQFEHCDAFLLIGSHLQKEQPTLALRLRKAINKGAQVAVVNPMNYQFNFAVTAKRIVAPQFIVKTLQDIVNALQSNTKLKDESTQSIVDTLQNKKSICILLGALAENHFAAARIRYLAQQLATLTNATVALLSEGANSAGAWLAGAVPHRDATHSNNKSGLPAYHMLKDPLQAYLLLNVEPELDTANAHQTIQALQKAHCVIALSVYQNPALEKYADVILPIAPFTETSGTFVNVLGMWQSFKGVAKAFASSRPAWKVLRVLGNFLQLPDFDYDNSESIKRELKTLLDHQLTENTTISFSEKNVSSHHAQLMRIGEIPIYATDSIVRRAMPLQQTQTLMEGHCDVVRIHPEMAKQLQFDNHQRVLVRQQDAQTILQLQYDERVPMHAVWIAGGVNATHQLGDLFGEVQLENVSSL